MSSETAREAGLPYPAPNKDSLLSPCLEGQGSYARDDKEIQGVNAFAV